MHLVLSVECAVPVIPRERTTNALSSFMVTSSTSASVGKLFSMNSCIIPFVDLGEKPCEKRKSLEHNRCRWVGYTFDPIENA